MCGIIGFTGNEPAKDIIIGGLERLEYRGYDSAGLALLSNDQIQVRKRTGKVEELRKLCEAEKMPATCGIGHTRWATHGGVTDVNAHPHRVGKVVLIHNGIIENYRQIVTEYGLADQLVSETDSEVVAALLNKFYEGDPVKAIKKTVKVLSGAFALCIMFQDIPDTIYAIRNVSPMVATSCERGSVIASDLTALIEFSKEYFVVPEYHILTLKKDGIDIQDLKGNKVTPQMLTVNWDITSAQKGGYPFFMLKEIYEQPDQKERKKEFNTEMDIQALLKQLNELTGMQSVKTEINNMINLLKICKIRQENGLQTPPVTNHMVFLGNPGTGKTTVARILAKIYHGLGVLSKGHLVEVDRSGLVAGYMGQTSEKVTEVIEKAKGGILFIDEAYALANGQQGDFGQEAIDILNKAMEDNREDLIVIAAGYHDEMQDFLDANPGLRSRFNRTIEFPNYDAEELLEIMTNRAKSLDYTLTDDAVQYVQDTFTRILACPPENFGNARSVRNYLDRVIHNQANRLIAENNFKEEDLTKLTLADVQSETLE